MSSEGLGFAERLRMLGSFLRLPLFGWSLALPILGMLTVSDTNRHRAVIAVAMALPFQVVLAVVNDLADMEIDRGDPRKAGRPLVSGLIQPPAAIIFVICAVLVAFVGDPTLLGFGPGRITLLAVAFAATAAYNVAGKRTPVPVVMDFLQGVGAGAFASYGAAAAGSPTWRTLLVAISVVVFMTFVNGVHGGLRDLTSDFAFGARTTPILWGAKPSECGSPYIPRYFIAYAWTLQFALVGLTGSEFARYLWDGSLPLFTGAVFLGFTGMSFASLYLSLNSSSDMSRRYVFAGAQILMGFGMIATLAAGRSGGLVGLGIFMILLIPLLARRSIRWVGSLKPAPPAP